MRSILFLVVMLALVSGWARAADMRREDRRPDGTLAARYSVDSEGKRDGRYEAFAGDGRKVVESATYVHGKLSGMRTLSDEKGKMVAEETWIDGLLVYPKSQQMMQRTFATIDAAAAMVADNRPGKGPTGLALPSPKELAEALSRVKTYRYLCDVPYEDVTIDPELTDICQHGAEILARIGTLSHKPGKPAGMDEEFYKRGYKGTSESNLFMGMAMPMTPDGYMNDSDPSNIDRVGHRRWVINPWMLKTGFGAKGKFSAMYSFDCSRTAPPANPFVCFPPRGYCPVKLFHPNYAWHCSPLPTAYKTPHDPKASVWPLDTRLKRYTAEPLKLNYEKLNTEGFAKSPAIIFRPDKFVPKAGASYEVEITGLEKLDGTKDAIRYIVTFY